MPLLHGNGSAASVASTCRTLQQLCCSTAASLRLTPANCRKPSGELALAVERFQRFPRAASALLELERATELEALLPTILFCWQGARCSECALRHERRPLMYAVGGMHVRAAKPCFCCAAAAACLACNQVASAGADGAGRSSGAGARVCRQDLLALHLLHARLPQLCVLALRVHGACLHGDLVLQSISSGEQLSQLPLDVRGDGGGLELVQLAALSILSQRCHLELAAENVTWAAPPRGGTQPGQAACWLAGLRSLMHLRAPMLDCAALAAAGGLRGLRNLDASRPASHSPHPCMDDAAAAALCQLAALTHLDLESREGATRPSFVSALAALTALEWICVESATNSTLDVLARLPRLTECYCRWVGAPCVGGGGVGASSSSSGGHVTAVCARVVAVGFYQPRADTP